jgi:hypothetical protein
MRGEKILPQLKPVKGAKKAAIRSSRAEVEADEKALKAEAKRLDGNRCRWPHETEAERRACAALRLESAHIGEDGRTGHKGAGGDPLGVRTDLELLMTFGAGCHAIFDKGPELRRVEFLTPKRARGPCAFEVERGGEFVEIGREVSVGVLMSTRRRRSVAAK